MKKSDSAILDVSKLSSSEALQAQRIQNEHEERMFRYKDIVMTCAKAFSLSVISLSCAVCLYLVVKEQNDELIDNLTQIVMCVLSFLAGRSTNR